MNEQIPAHDWGWAMRRRHEMIEFWAHMIVTVIAAVALIVIACVIWRMASVPRTSNCVHEVETGFVTPAGMEG